MAQHRVHDSHYDSFVDQETALPGWAQRYRQIGRGRFRGQVTTLQMGDLWISRERFNRSMEHRFTLAPDRVGLWVLLRGTGVLHNAHGDFGPGDAGLAGPGRTERAFFEGPGDVIVLTLPHEGGDFGAGHLRGGAAGGARALGDWLAVILEMTATGLADPRLVAMLPDLVRDRLVGLLDPPEARACDMPRRHAFFEAILDAASRLPAEERTAAGLARRLGAPRASLRQACRAATGCDLDAFLSGRRLSEVHRCLRNARPDELRVSQAGMEMGFVHFGRFSGAYRDMFGEPPSRTLRHAAPRARNAVH